MKSEQLAFKTIEGRHTGKNIAQILARTTSRYNLHSKAREFPTAINFTPRLTRAQIGWFTSDGAAVNGTTIRALEKDFDSETPVWKAKDHDIL